MKFVRKIVLLAFVGGIGASTFSVSAMSFMSSFPASLYGQKVSDFGTNLGTKIVSSLPDFKQTMTQGASLVM